MQLGRSGPFSCARHCHSYFRAEQGEKENGFGNDLGHDDGSRGQVNDGYEANSKEKKENGFGNDLSHDDGSRGQVNDGYEANALATHRVERRQMVNQLAHDKDLRGEFGYKDMEQVLAQLPEHWRPKARAILKPAGPSAGRMMLGLYPIDQLIQKSCESLF